MRSSCSTEVVYRPFMITETGRVLPLPPKRTPPRSSKSMRLPTKRFGPVFSATEVVNKQGSCKKFLHKRKNPQLLKVVGKKTHNRNKERSANVVSPRMSATEDPMDENYEKCIVNTDDEHLETLSETSFSESDTCSESDSPRLNALSGVEFPDENEDGVNVTSSAYAVLFPQREYRARGTSSAPWPDPLNLKIENRSMTEVVVTPRKNLITQGELREKDGTRVQVTSQKNNPNLEVDLNVLASNSKNLLIYNTWHLHMHSRFNELPDNHMSTNVRYIEGRRSSNLAQLAHARGRNSCEPHSVSEEAVGYSERLRSEHSRYVSSLTETPNSSVAGRELGPSIPSLQGTQLSQRSRSQRGVCVHYMD